MKCPYFQSDCLKEDCTAFEKRHIEYIEHVTAPSHVGGVITSRDDPIVTENYCRLLKSEIPLKRNDK